MQQMTCWETAQYLRRVMHIHLAGIYQNPNRVDKGVCVGRTLEAQVGAKRFQA